MPPAAKKDFAVVLYDLNTKTAAMQTIMKISCLKFFSNSKDLMELVLVNTKNTKNRLAGRKDGYECISEVSDNPVLYEPTTILSAIDNAEAGGRANFLEALLVALRALESDSESIGGIITHQILFITDLSTPISNPNETLVREVIDRVNALGAFLYIVGPTITPPFTINTAEDVQSWMHDHLPLYNTNINMSLLKRIVQATDNSVVCDYKCGIHLFSSYKKWGGTQPWKVPLAIGSKIEFEAETVKVVKQEELVKVIQKKAASTMDIWVSAEDETKEYDPSEIIHGITYHGKFVEMQDNAMFKCDNPRGFNALCFTKTSNVPEYIMQGEGTYLVLPSDTPEATQALGILVDRLAERDQCVIARRVYNRNLTPKFVALLPKPDHSPKCLMLVYLPYSEDVRVDYSEKSVSAAPKAEVPEEVSQFLGGLDASKHRDKVPLGVSMMNNWNTNRIINKVADKYLERYLHLEEVDLDYVNVRIENNFEAQLKDSWPEREPEAIAKKPDDGGDSDSGDEFSWD